MIRHIVLLRFKETEKEECIRYARNKLKTLSQLDTISAMEMGVDIEDSPYSDFHLSVICTFNSMEELERYQQDPLHKQFAKWLKLFSKQRACVDYYTK
jgi:Stress responsive A/B Barrel Domain